MNKESKEYKQFKEYMILKLTLNGFKDLSDLVEQDNWDEAAKLNGEAMFIMASTYEASGNWKQK